MYKNTYFKDLNRNAIYFCTGLIGLLLLACAAKVAQAAEDIDPVSDVIQEGINECGTLKNDACKAVMMTLNNVCQVAYFEACFGSDQWAPTMEYISKLIKEGHLEREDPYLTLNNEHFGNDSMS
jgi:hypothetical protein